MKNLNALRIILLLDAARGFDRGLLRGISRYSALHGRWTFYHRPPGYLSTHSKVGLAEFKRWKPDGVICSVEKAGLLTELQVPMIYTDPNEFVGDIPSIQTDNREVGRLAARHLMDSGQQHFAFCGYGRLGWSRVRGDSFSEYLEASGFQTDMFPAVGASVSWSKEEQQIRTWIDQLPKPVGLFCANDDRAAAVSEICHSLGLNIPNDISIIGADNDEMLCELANPPFSSIRIASDQAGYAAAELLEKLIGGSVKMEGQQVIARAAGVAVRQSTNILMVQHPALRKALQFIRENITHPVQVSDIVRAAGLSHRALNELFQRELGTSIGKYLTRARIKHISYLLLNSSLQIQEVADAVGYEDIQHFSRYFKHSTGLTPLAYRRKMLVP